MSRPVAGSASSRDADNEFYDFGCSLVEAAAEICRVAASPDAAPAVPALLEFLEAALHELSCAAAALQQTTRGPGDLVVADARSRAIADRLARGYGNLSVALEDVRAAARAARPLAARSQSAARARAAG